MTMAQMGLNAALVMSGIGTIVVIIGLIVAAIYKWVQSVGGLKVAWLTVCNAVMTAWDWVKIGFFTGVYWVIDLWERMKLGIMTAATAIAWSDIIKVTITNSREWEY